MEENSDPKSFEWKLRIEKSKIQCEELGGGTVIREKDAIKICKDPEDHYLRIIKKVGDYING